MGVIINNFLFLYKHDKMKMNRRLKVKNIIKVVAAVIEKDTKILCAQRKAGQFLSNKWEFPGGKIEPGELPVDALKREIREELNCDIEMLKPLHTTGYELGSERIILYFYSCRIIAGKPKAIVHNMIQWIDKERITELDWAPADLEAVKLIFKKIIKR